MRHDYQMFPVILGNRFVPRRLEAFPFYFQKKGSFLIPEQCLRMYKCGYYQCSLYVIFNIKMDLYFYFGLNSHLLQRPPNFWDLFLALRVEERGKRERKREDSLPVERHIMYTACVFLHMVLQIEEKINSLASLRNVSLERHCKCSQKSIFQIETGGTRK